MRQSRVIDSKSRSSIIRQTHTIYPKLVVLLASVWSFFLPD